MKHTALLIIDVQMGAFDGVKISPVYGGTDFLSRLKKLVVACRCNDVPIIYIQDCGEKGGAFEKDTEQWNIHTEVAPKLGDVIVQKKRSNAFAKPSLDLHLNMLCIDTLIMCGLHSQYCFTDICIAALGAKYKVIVPESGHVTCGTKETADTIIIKQNEKLLNLGAEIVGFSDLLAFLSTNSV